MRTDSPQAAQLLRDLRRLAHRYRRTLAAVLTAAAVLAAMSEARSAPAPAADVAASTALSVPAGHLALPTRIADAAAVDLIPAGGTVDVLGQTAEGAVVVVARGVPVVQRQTGTSGGLLPSSESGALVVLDVTEDQAVAVAAAQQAGPITVAIRPAAR